MLTEAIIEGIIWTAIIGSIAFALGMKVTNERPAIIIAVGLGATIIIATSILVVTTMPYLPYQPNGDAMLLNIILSSATVAGLTIFVGSVISTMTTNKRLAAITTIGLSAAAAIATVIPIVTIV